MKPCVFVLFIALTSAFFFSSCHKETSSSTSSQRFVHKYGFDLSEKEWQERKQEGQVITTQEDGTIVTHTFSNGILHGLTTYTFPNSKTIAKAFLYEEGSLTKVTSYNSSGLPIQQESYELDDRRVLARWDLKGVPIAIEEYSKDLLWKGQYFSPRHELEASIEEGKGLRICRHSETSVLLSKETFEQGKLLSRINYHSNGQIQSQASFSDYQLHGKQVHFSPSGEPLMEAEWDHGLLNGLKILYRNGNKFIEIPYVFGKKHGLEKEYDENGSLVTEIHWDNNERHGSTRHYRDNEMSIEWFYRGNAVSLQEFQKMEFREKLTADLYGEKKKTP